MINHDLRCNTHRANVYLNRIIWLATSNFYDWYTSRIAFCLFVWALVGSGMHLSEVILFIGESHFVNAFIVRGLLDQKYLWEENVLWSSKNSDWKKWKSRCWCVFASPNDTYHSNQLKSFCQDPLEICDVLGLHVLYSLFQPLKNGQIQSPLVVLHCTADLKYKRWRSETRAPEEDWSASSWFSTCSSAQ